MNDSINDEWLSDQNNFVKCERKALEHKENSSNAKIKRSAF